MCKIIAVANQKGGTAKTTTTLNLGAALAEASKRVLLIDFDPQAALTLAHGINPLGLKQTIYDGLLDNALPLTQIIVATQDGPDLVPANLNLAGAEVELLSEIGRELFLKEKLEPVQAAYDFVLIDCPPSLGLLTINALAASDEVLIPVQTQYFAFKAIQYLENE
jgi:chromosome partitioning protein